MDQEQICRLFLSDPAARQYFLNNCPEEVSKLVWQEFESARVAVGLTELNASPELFEAQLHALDWSTINKLVDEVRCFWPDCDLSVYQKAESSNPFMSEVPSSAASNNPFQGKPSEPVNIPAAVYLGIILIVAFYFATSQGFSLSKLRDFLDRFIHNLKRYGQRNSS